VPLSLLDYKKKLERIVGDYSNYSRNEYIAELDHGMFGVGLGIGGGGGKKIVKLYF
jgi:hypothetical protein